MLYDYMHYSWSFWLRQNCSNISVCWRHWHCPALTLLVYIFKDLKPQHNLSSNKELLSFFKLNAMPFLQLGIMQLFEKSSVRSFRYILYHHDVVFIICVLAFSFLSFYHTVFNLHGFKKAFKTISHQIIKRYLPLVLLRQLYCNIDHLN